ncbi:5'-3' exoribonuclease 2-like [Aegilops tauschii subsp. strangulata]|uniref:5'-3' exoribonuclease 2-like n=1 Tax=Aegilops tauschii subsp. strangulata TaxID=200361 RepID=UPI003CC89F01
MGVPSFYRWLVEKYPNIVTPAVEEEDCPAGGAAAVYFDNLYLDMNGIIHACFHPEDQTVTHMPMHYLGPCTISRVLGRSGLVSHLRLLRTHAGVPSSGDVRRGVPVHVRLHGPPAPHVRPRRLLYLAVDGVAPRAKMNQQRARRFKSAKAAKEAELEESIMRERFRAQGKEVLPRDDAPREVSDPNIITPGTEFMEKLSAALEYYVRARLSSHPRWKDVKVILSDANVPGEGEHKIMSFIRAQRSMESYDPNTRHCLYGLDVLRQNHQPDICVPVTDKSFTAQELPKVKCRGWFPRITEARSKGKLPKKPYQFLNIWVLREYLELEMTIPGCKHDIDRLIDDFIFICFLTGNDFIPHIPSLEIHEYAVDLLIDVYKTMYKKMGGYIVDTDKIKDKHAAYVKISRLEKFLHELSLHEEKIFLKRYELREKLLRKIQRQAAEDEWNERNYEIVEESADVLEQECISVCTDDKPDVTENTLELKRDLKDNLRSKQDLFKNGSSKHDRIRLGLPGWKSRFYKEKFGAETSNEIGRLQTEMVQKYLEGLCWVLRYYFSDVPSWSCSCALPKCYSKLMACEESTIQMFYPSDLAIDTHGKRFLWQGVAKLPFIDVKLLLSATQTVEKDLALHEMRRNTIRQEKILLRNSSSLANNAAFAPISEKKILISTRSAMFFNPEAVKPISRLLDNVIVPDKTVTESDIRTRPMWHTYPGPRPPTVTCRPDTLWKGSSPAMQPREEVKNAGTGWMGRGRGGFGAATTETQQIRRNGFWRGRGDAAGGSDGRGFQGGWFDGGADGGAYSFRPGGGWTGRGSAVQKQQQTAWRPVGTWARGGGRGGSGQPRAW